MTALWFRPLPGGTSEPIFLKTPALPGVFFWRHSMWKIALAFVAFAGLAIFILSKGGDIDMGGEKHGIEVTHEAPLPASAASAASAPAR